MQVPILNGIYADGTPDFRTSYPRNYVPVPKPQGISEGYLRPADGVVKFGDGPGNDRGGVNWRGALYRVMGTKLVSIDRAGAAAVLGDVGAGGMCSFAYSPTKLAVASGGKLFYWDGIALAQVTDPDLGPVLDVQFVDGYFLTTDGAFLVVTELNDPTQVDPFKYGSSELNPDPIVRPLIVRNEVHAVNRYTIEVFTNVGGLGFPFQRNNGAQLHRGAVGTHAAVVLPGSNGRADAIAFLGSAVNEPPAVWLGALGSTQKISTREIDTILQGYSEAQLADTFAEVRVDKSHEQLILHLPDRALVYDAAASAAVGQPVWFFLDSGVLTPATYRARGLVWVYDQWVCGDPLSPQTGVLTSRTATHYGATVGWEFGTLIVYNEGRGAIFHELELVGLPGDPEPVVAAVPPGLAFYSNDWAISARLSETTILGPSVTSAIVAEQFRLTTPANVVGAARFDLVPNHTDADASFRAPAPNLATNDSGDFALMFLTTYWGDPTGVSLGYMLQIRRTELRLGKGSNRGDIAFADTPVTVLHGVTPGQFATWRVKYETVGDGKRIRFWVNGVQVVDYTDPFPWVSGQVAFRGFANTQENWLADDFSITYNVPALPGQGVADPMVWTSYSPDGRTFSREMPARGGRAGERDQRIVWRRQGLARHWRLQRFRGLSNTRIPFARLEARIEGLK